MLNCGSAEIDMMFAFAEVICAENVSYKIRSIRLSGLQSLYGYLNQYEKMGYCEKIISGIAEKKIKMIMKANSKTETNEILKPQYPKYDGNKFTTNQYSVPEEELIGWSKASLTAPLNTIGCERYMEVFKSVFPKINLDN